MLQSYRSASTDEDIVKMATYYFNKFPDSHVSTECLLRYMLSGGAIDWKSGALFHPRHGKPDAEVDVAQDDIDEDTKAQTVSTGELIEAGIGFDMRESESPFIQEWVSDEAGDFVLALDGELKSVRVRERNDTEMELLEPLTEGEAFTFIAKLLVQEVMYDSKIAWWTVACAAIEHRNGQLLERFNTRRARLQQMLQEATENFEEFLRWAGDHNGQQRRTGDNEFVSAFALYDIDALEWRRARASVRRYNINGQWSQEGQWFIGEREGITHGREELNDAIYSRGDQEHRPGERIDGVGLLHEEEEWCLTDEATAQYRKQGTVTPSKLFNSLYTNYKRVWDKEMKEWVMEFVQAADGGPINRGWTDRSIYLLRQELKRDEYFAEKLWRILTWPLEALELGFPAIEKAYIESIKACAPGPGRKSNERISPQEMADIVKLGWFKPGQRWHNVPIYGQRAIAWLKEQSNLGNLSGCYVHKSIRVITGESWHKTLLRREQLNALRESLQWRRDNAAYVGLPMSYVARKY